MNTSALIVSAVAFVALLFNAYFMRMGLREGNRRLALSAATAVIVFGVVGLVFFARAF